MTPSQFSAYIDRYLNSLAGIYGVADLNVYYSCTDFLLPEIQSLSGIPQAFAQFVLHAQNGTMIGNIVRFFEKYQFLKEKLFDFNPQSFLSGYGCRVNANGEAENRDEVIKSVVEALRYSENNPRGLRWSTANSEKKDFIAIRFANTLIDGALYFRKFVDRTGVRDDFLSHYPTGDTKTLIMYTMSVFPHGFSVALCCDFLKEFDPAFDLPKPDVHLMEVLAKLKGKDRDYYKLTQKKAFECIQGFLDVVNEIKKASNPDMTAYKLDRQIWLCCTGRFFLNPSNGSLKAGFLAGIN